MGTMVIQGRRASDGALVDVKVQDDGSISLGTGTVEIDTTGLATSAKQDTGNTSLASIATNTTGAATSAKQDTGNTSLATIATNSGTAATAANQTTANSSLSTIATNTTGAATAANQTTANTSLSTIATNTTGVATAANQSTANTSLASIDGKVGASAVAADAKSNITAGLIQGFLSALNGAGTPTWDRVRAGIKTVGTAITGFLDVIPFAHYNTTPTTRTDGQSSPLEADSAGNLRGAEQFAPAAEDNTIGVIKVEHRYTNSRVTASGATNAIKSGAGFIHSISVDKWVTGLVIDIYDALTVTGTPIRKITLSSTDTGPIPASIVDIPFATGLTVNLSAAADVGISYR